MNLARPHTIMITHPEVCAGNKRSLCHAGKTVQVDCRALGFSGCVAGNCTP